MGLDLVELVMEVEETFGVSIPDDDASELVTAGEVFDYVVAKRLAGMPQGLCLTSVAFYRVRRALTSTLALTRRDIRPATKLASLLPEENRRLLWQTMQDAVDLRFPKLVHPSWLARTIGVGTALPMLALFEWGFQESGGAVGLLILLIPALLVWLTLFTTVSRLAERWATQVDKSCPTVGDLAREVLAKNYSAIADRAKAWNPEEAWEVFVGIVSQQLGVDRAKVTRDASFVHDLGAG